MRMRKFRYTIWVLPSCGLGRNKNYKYLTIYNEPQRLLAYLGMGVTVVVHVLLIV